MKTDIKKEVERRGPFKEKAVRSKKGPTRDVKKHSTGRICAKKKKIVFFQERSSSQKSKKRRVTREDGLPGEKCSSSSKLSSTTRARQVKNA